MLLPIWCIAAFLLFMFFRLSVAWFTRHRGCDAWFFLLCAEQFRIHRRLPVRLPSLYMLEPDEQWYPPGFIVFCALFSDAFLKKYHWAITHIVDGIIACILFLGGYTITGQIPLSLWGVAMYALQPALIMEYSNLTSRPLGCAFQFAFVLCSYAGIHCDLYFFPAAIFFGVLLLYTHKLSTQILWFLFPFFAIMERDVSWVFILFFTYFIAFLLRPGYFTKILRAHWDIVRFWHKHWAWLGAHQVKDSPLYGHQPFRAGYYAQSWSFFLRSFIKTVLTNCTIVFTIPALIFFNNLDLFAQFCLFWVLGVHIWAIFVQFLPFLRCIGIGIQYLKYSYLPSLFLAVELLFFFNGYGLYNHSVAIILLMCLLYKYARLIRHCQKNRPEQECSEDLDNQFNFLRNAPDARILTLPLSLADITAYKTRKPVCWGTHGYGFVSAEYVLPVLKKKLSWLMKRYGLTHLLLDERYTNIRELQITPDALLKREGYYAVYQLSETSFVKQ